MYFSANKLTLSEKTEFMLFGSRQRLSQIISDPILTIESESIKCVSSPKTLGVVANDASPGKTSGKESRKGNRNIT